MLSLRPLLGNINNAYISLLIHSFKNVRAPLLIMKGCCFVINHQVRKIVFLCMNHSTSSLLGEWVESQSRF